MDSKGKVVRYVALWLWSGSILSFTRIQGRRYIVVGQVKEDSNP